MKAYVAAENWEAAQEICHALVTEHGIQPVSSWHIDEWMHEWGMGMSEAEGLDMLLNELHNAEGLLVIEAKADMSWFEMGYCIARGRKVAIISKENTKLSSHPLVKQCYDLQEAVEWLLN